VVRNAKEQNLLSITIAEDDIKFTSPGAFEYFFLPLLLFPAAQPLLAF